jgi:hypothetical protein
VKRVKRALVKATLSVGAVVLTLAVMTGTALGAGSAGAGSQHMAINCALASAMCTEVANSDDVFGHYVGHDEPSMLFDSPVAGSGNHMRYNITLPTEPPASKPDRARQVLQLRAQRSRMDGHGALRHAVLPGAGEHMPAGQR